MSSTNKRPLIVPTCTSSDNTEPPSKKKKLSEHDAVDFTSKLHEISKDDRINDVEFTIKNNDQIEIIRGLKAFFAAHSNVFKSMLYNKHMKESQTNKVIIDDVTINAFTFIKEYTHFANPELEYEHVIDILYAAKKYMMTNIIQKCKNKIYSMNTLNQFYLITSQINKYSSNVFESLFDDILKQCFLKPNVINILADDRSQSLHIKQIQGLVQIIIDNYKRYCMTKKYCQSVSNEWKNIFEKDFKHLINFDKLSLHQLVNEIGLDKILDNKTFLSLIDAKNKENETDMQENMRIKDAKIKSLEEEIRNLNSSKKRVLTQNRTLRTENNKLRKKYYYISDSSSDSSSSD
eukprot:443566_1